MGKEDQAFLKKIKAYPTLDIALFEKALRFAKHYHGNQLRKSGEAFYLHPLAVAQKLLQVTQDQNTLLAALLHDILENTVVTRPQLEATFGKEITVIVATVSNLHDKSTRKIKLKKINKFVQLSSSDNPKVLLVKLYDRLHNMETLLGHKSATKRKQIAQETLEYFVPLAKTLGKESLSKQLATLAKNYV